MFWQPRQQFSPTLPSKKEAGQDPTLPKHPALLLEKRPSFRRSLTEDSGIHGGAFKENALIKVKNIDLQGVQDVQ